jgi:anti-anti-sigma regulatory factor
MLEIAPGWRLDIDRGPNWLFVTVREPGQNAWDTPPLAERLWALLQAHLVDRLILELGEIKVLNSYLLGQLVLLHKQICTHGGVMRLSGLSQSNQEVLHLFRLDDRFPHYCTREEAILGCYCPEHSR